MNFGNENRVQEGLAEDSIHVGDGFSIGWQESEQSRPWIAPASVKRLWTAKPLRPMRHPFKEDKG